MSGCCFPSAAAVLSFCATLLKAYFVCFDLSISVRDLFRVTGEGRKDAEWIGTAPNSWSVLTNARGSRSARGQRDRKMKWIIWLLGTAGLCSWHTSTLFPTSVNDADRIYVTRDLDSVSAWQSLITSILPVRWIYQLLSTRRSRDVSKICLCSWPRRHTLGMEAHPNDSNFPLIWYYDLNDWD